MKRGDIYEAVVTDYDFPNKGSLMLEDRKITIKGALAGQKVRFMITKRKMGKAEGRVLEVLEKSPLEDCEPSCQFFGGCGGCSYQMLSYDNQLKLKENMVKKLLDKVIDPSSYEWEGILPSPVQQGYRNKMEFTFGDEYKGGPLALGLHKKGGFHDIINVSGCEIVGEDWSRILDFTLSFFSEKKVPFYHRMKHVGILRYLVIRQSYSTGEFLINLVAADQWDKWENGLKADGKCEAGCLDSKYSYKNLLDEYVAGLLELEKEDAFVGSIAGILYTKNNSLGDVVQSDGMVCLYGRDYIVEEVMGLKFKISPFSFFQTNTKGCEVLYEKSREYIMSGDVMKSPDKVVFDLYSGTGTIAQMMSAASKKVIGIEIVEEAVEAAKVNAKQNGLENCKFIAGDVLKAIDLVEDNPDVIILDPPRDGINPKALDKILDYEVSDVVYISCKPTSLVRDLEIITRRGYRVVKACAVDQFPGTGHVETVVLMSKVQN